MCSTSRVPPTKPLLPNPDPPRVSEPFPARPTQNGPCWDLPQPGQAATASAPQPCSRVCSAGVRGLWAAPALPSSGLIPGVWCSPGPLRAQGPGAGVRPCPPPPDYAEALPSRGKHLQALDASLGPRVPTLGPAHAQERGLSQLLLRACSFAAHLTPAPPPEPRVPQAGLGSHAHMHACLSPARLTGTAEIHGGLLPHRHVPQALGHRALLGMAPWPYAPQAGSRHL